MDANDQARREKEIFDQALDLASAAERLAFLKEACGADVALLARVQALLQAHEAAEDFLPDQPLGQPRPVPGIEKPGDRIGRYTLREQIGEGGCGVVYAAEQEEPVRRKVALKVIKLGMDTKNVVARFEAERQALAMMDHPNIAKVLDAGATETGRPYFVMELVHGCRVTDYCNRNLLSIKDRLELFIKVCQAVQHAHQKSVIHRDLKPSNILVTLHDGVPVPKVIDFGIAKATGGRLTDLTVYTDLHQFLGTPAYMSPEQATMTSLDIDTRSDIYSLGVLLYELLTGHTPFDPQKLAKDGLDAVRRTICEVEPPRPSTRLNALHGEALAATAERHGTNSRHLVKLMRGDLDWITMKCLEKDRARRYETANGLAMDLKRYLGNELVMARPPSTAYRWQKTLRRNKTPIIVATVTSIALALLAVISVTVWQLVESRKPTSERTLNTAYQLGIDGNGSRLPVRFRLFDNTNPNRVYNSPRAFPVWSTSKATQVTQIDTYHWNNGRGAIPGDIFLVGEGHKYGPWRAIGFPGSGNVPSVNWVVRPNVILLPGTYRIIDSSVSTWSWNTNSGGAGFARVWGF